MTWFTAFYFHWVVLLVMAAILVNGPESTVNLLLNAAFAEDFEPDTRPFEVVAPMPSASEVEDAARPDPAVVDTEPSTMSETNLSLNSSVVDELSKSDSPSIQTDKTPPTDSEVTPPHQVRQMPLIVPEDAVSEGSFSVWTEPSQPIAGKPYRIVIQVRLPDGLKKYDVSDLQGMVVGSDGYRKPVPGSVRGGLPIDSGYARLVVPIVSADAQVRDTVFIRSKLLRESQKLVLQF